MPNFYALRYRGYCRPGVDYIHLVGTPRYDPIVAFELIRSDCEECGCFLIEGGGEAYFACFQLLPEGGRWYLIHRGPQGGVPDYPAPPLPTQHYIGRPSRWTRFVTKDFQLALLPGGGVETIDDAFSRRDVMNFAYFTEPAAEVLCRRYNKCEGQDIRWRLPGSGKLVGEEFRVKEVEGDYLRLVGRGGDEYIAWDFVLGTLDTGEWVLMGEDGLYVGVLKDERVVAERPYEGLLVNVVGPPGAYLYPVVPTRSFKHARSYDAYLVEDVELLRWPLNAAPPRRCAAALSGAPVLVGVDRGVALCCKEYKCKRLECCATLKRRRA
ncbi:MAG: hypothetical protein QXI84_07515 [Thermofilaceae archaeon]